MSPDLMYDLIIVGGGPCGLSTAVAAHEAGLRYLVIEKGAVVHSLTRFPIGMQFFSTAELLEIGDVPFLSDRPRPRREEAMAYYRRVVSKFDLNVHQFETVTGISGEKGNWQVESERREGPAAYKAHNIVLATGYYDNPNKLGVPGEDLPHVSHYYTEGHSCFGQRVLVVGGQNSAVDAAMDLQRCGADVTMAQRRPDLSSKIKPWVLPEFEALVRKDEVRLLTSTKVTEIKPGAVVLREDGNTREEPFDFVYLMTGYHPDHAVLQKLGVASDDASGKPVYNPETMETNVPGLYVAGVIAAGNEANVIFIENGRFHGPLIAAHVAGARATV